MRLLLVLALFSSGCTSRGFGRGVATVGEVARDAYVVGAMVSTLAAAGSEAEELDTTIYTTSSQASCEACPPNATCFYVDFTCPARR